MVKASPGGGDGDPTTRAKRRVAVAGFSGTLVELYDFIIYGTAAALVFPEIFFPALGTAAGTVASFATFGVAFIARPFGGVLFGHFGDRLGRKTTLVTTLLLMGVATVLVGLVPTAEQIGMAAPICLVLLRIVQGLAAGGEWAGATLFSAEHAPKGKRGFWTMFPQLGATFAFSLANGTFLLAGLGMSDEAFASWGWRIPFILSIVLIAVGLWVRLTIEESPVFKGEIVRSGASKIPILEAVQHQPREIVLAGGVGLTTFSFFFVTGTYLTNYATGTLELTRTLVLSVGVVGGLILSLGVLIGAPLADRVGRRPVIAGANIAGTLWSLAMFPILDHGSFVTFALVLWVTMLIAGFNYGPLASFIPELFQTRYRYTAAAISYNLGTVIGGAVAPLLAPALTVSYGAFAFGGFLALLCLTATACTLILRETRDTEMDHV
ncbi:MFS transporter [Rhodococcus koreensis]|uniref:MFS transporter n=1 Tax=Rhodococcus koreensis TaxID=99653 RepID=UPI00366BEB03